MNHREDLTGQMFGLLTVIELRGIDENRHAHWKCKCECGNIHTVLDHSLKSGNTKSCGCLKVLCARRLAGRRQKKASASRVYSIGERYE